MSKTPVNDAPEKTIRIGASTFTISPEAGCRLMQWKLSSIQQERDILYWPKNVSGPLSETRGGNPILFPFCGRSFNKGLIGFWNAGTKGIRPMPLHGFANRETFTLNEKGSNFIECTLIPSPEAHNAYPFAYRFTVRYEFEELGFSVSLSLTNDDHEAIPWCAGHHFYFNLPWHAGATRQDYQLHMEARKSAYQAPDGKLVASRERNTLHRLGDPALIDRIHWELRHNPIAFGPMSGEEDVFIHIGEQERPSSTATIVTWSESPDAPYYCIEPWMGPPNAPEHGKGLHWVNPGEQETFMVKVTLY